MIFVHFNNNNNSTETCANVFFIIEDITNDWLLFSEKTFRIDNGHMMIYSKCECSVFQPYALTRYIFNGIFISKWVLFIFIFYFKLD